MAIVYPLALPTTPTPSRMLMRSVNAVALSQSPFTFEQQVFEHQGGMWAAEISLPPMERATAALWIAFKLKLRGRNGTFLLVPFSAKTPRGSGGGTPQVDGASQTGLILSTKGWPVSTNGVLLASDYLQIGTGATSRFYQTLNDVDTDAGGLATLDIWPRLRESPADSATIKLTNPEAVFRLANNISEWDIDTASIYGLGISAMEAI